MDNDIKAYDTYRKRTFGEKGLPENVRHELNIDSLCGKLDFTSSCIGRQYLYHIVCKDEISEVRVVELLGKLNKPDAYTITELLYGRHTDYSQSYIHEINPHYRLEYVGENQFHTHHCDKRHNRQGSQHLLCG